MARTTNRTGTCGACNETITLTKDGDLVGHTNDHVGQDCLGSYDRPIPDQQTLGILAWDISDAFAKTVDDHGLDFGMDEIEAALPAFIAAIQANVRNQV